MEPRVDRLAEVLDAVSKEDSVKLRELASYYSDEAAVSQEEGVIKLALITYCFHKIFIKIHLKEKSEGLVNSTLKNLAEGRFDDIIADIGDFDSRHWLFEGGLVGKARIKIASRMHSRGISLTQSASLTGASVSDLLDFVGQTKGYEHREGKTVQDRLNIARDALK